ncbi:MAG: TIGR03768 family metallophosphoesterase [bacterium]
MKSSNEFKRFCLVFWVGMLIFSSAGYSKSDASQRCSVHGYPIDSTVVKTTVRTVVPVTTFSGKIIPQDLKQISKYKQYGYGKWTFGGPLTSDPRNDIMPAGYDCASAAKKTKLLNFFTMSDIHITDKESPSQLIYLQQLFYPSVGKAPWSFETSVYSPVMMYTTHVLDAAVQTVNALHKKNPIDFGLSLGDTCNSTQYNELRWYIDVLDGKVITPSSGAHLGADSIDYQKPYKAAGLDKTIPWYQTMGNHDHFWIGSLPVNDFLRQSCISDTVIAMEDVMYKVLINPGSKNNPEYYMGVIDGSTPDGDIIHAGPVASFAIPPKVAADPNRRSLLRTEWISEFFNTSSMPVGHGLNLVDPNQEKGFACYSFVPKSKIPLKVIVLDDTQRDDDGSPDIHGHGFLDQARWAWLKGELAAGDAAGQLMIIAAHVPIGVEVTASKSEMGWWLDPQNAVTLPNLIAELHSHPNLLMWLSGHRHLNTVKAFISPDPVNAPEKGFWEVETSSLRDFPQQFRTFEIYLNSDFTISIVTTDVDPAVKDGTPAEKSRFYAVATQQIVGNNLNPNFKTADPTIDPDIFDPTIKPMPACSYNATLLKQLSPEMQAKLRR